MAETAAQYALRTELELPCAQAVERVVAALKGEGFGVPTGDDLGRYVRVGTETTCRYCCNALTLVEPNGDAACGCAHSQAMRGSAAYLIADHASEFTDEEIVEGLNRWRAVCFPKQTLAEALVELRDAGEPGTEEIEQESREFMPQMVGGCRRWPSQRASNVQA
jgi:hypothetical protein